MDYSRALVVAAVMLAACDARVQLVEPRASAAPPAVLTLAASDTALATRAGWSPGVPATTVHIRRDQDLTILTYTTDDHGVLTLPDLPNGDYWIWAERYPIGDEAQPPVLAPAALGGGRRMGLGPGIQATIPLQRQENGSLVISEHYYNIPPVSVCGECINYHFQGYTELYNNSDTTIYLDGKIVGAGFDYYQDSPWPCTETQPFRSEPRGIWSQMFQAFPGTGREHPLAPGQTVVIAEQAIDHSTAYPGLPDLSHADFQFYWETRALNPAVPTMLPIQLRTSVPQTMPLTGPDVVFVSEAVDIASLDRMGGRYTGVDDALFPKAVILDLALIFPDYYMEPSFYGYTYCRTLVDPSLDPLAAFVKPMGLYYPDTKLLMAAQRKLLPDGRHLQRTGTSAADWEIRPRSPGKIP